MNRIKFFKQCRDNIQNDFKKEMLMIYKTLDNFSKSDDRGKLNEELKRSEKKLEFICAQSEALNADMLTVVKNLKTHTLH